MDFLTVTTSAIFRSELEYTLTKYEWPHSIELTDYPGVIMVHKKDTSYQFHSIRDFLYGILYYSSLKNLTHHPIENPKNLVVNYETSVLTYVRNHSILGVLYKQTVFRNYFHKIYNYGLYFRHASNKILRTMWFPVFAGMPLSAKPDPLKEATFFAHDLGHFILPDRLCLFDGNYDTELLKHMYTNFRLLGKSVTIVLNEMIGMHHLKDAGFNPDDKPFKLYQILIKTNMKEIFRASFDYFCFLKKDRLKNLIDPNAENKEIIWGEFDARFDPVASRGREWTESNFDHMLADADGHRKWWKVAGSFASELEIKTVEGLIDEIGDGDLFEYVWKNEIMGLFNGNVDVIDHEIQKKKIIKRVVINNLFPLVKYNMRIDDIVECIKSNCISDEMYEVTKDKITVLLQRLCRMSKISTDECETWKELFVMIPTNLIKKKEGKQYYNG